MASKKISTAYSSSTPPPSFIAQMIRDLNIPSSIQIRLLSNDEADNWKTSGLKDDNQIVLGRKHIETMRLPIHPLILQFLSALHLHPMQLTPNFLKFLTASIILNEVEKKNITVEDLLFVFKVKRTPTKLGAIKSSFGTYYLSASKNFYIFSTSVAVDKDWDSPRTLLVVSGEWIPKDFDRTIFPLVSKFSLGKHDFLHVYFCCDIL